MEPAFDGGVASHGDNVGRVMVWWRAIVLRGRAFLKRRQLDRDLEDEIQFHLEMRASRNRESGMDPPEARYAARRRFGNTSRWKEDLRAMWSIGSIESVAQDVRFAVRSLKKTPGFLAAAVLVFALGIGSTTAIFSVVNAVLLRSLPFEDPDRLVVLWGNVQRQKVERRGASYPDYIDWKTQSTSFENMAAIMSSSFLMTTATGGEQVSGGYAAPGYFELLGVKPAIGRTISAAEDVPGNPAPVVVIGDGFWSRQFGGSPDVLGRQVTLNQQQFTIIGVMPPGFHGLTDGSDLWIPFTASAPAPALAERGRREFRALARLKPGVSLQQAQSEMNGIAKRLEQAYPATNAVRGVEVARLSAEMTGALRTPLMILLGTVGFVLLVACANVSNLLLVRSASRRQEFAIRAALGAGRARMLRQLLTESILLALVGAGLGLVLAFWAIRLLTTTSPISLPTFANPQIDWVVAGFAIGLSAMAGLLAGVAPVLQMGREDVHVALKESGARSGEHLVRQRLRGALVIGEVAIAMMLLVGAALLMRSFLYLWTIEPGFEPKGVLALSMSIPRLQPGTAQQVSARQLLDRVRALPAVVSASISSDYPFRGDTSAFRFTAEGQGVVEAQSIPRAYRHVVSPEFFSTLRMPFIAGRTFTEAEANGRLDVIVVSENLTKRFWPGENPIGKRLKAGDAASKNPWWTIVGVVRETKFRGLPNNPTADPDVFFPLAGQAVSTSMLVRSAGDPTAIAGAVRAAIQEVDRSIVVFETVTLPERMARYTERSRFSSWMMGVFAMLALALASIGLYGVMAYVVRQRTREFGIRIAMGATGGEVIGMVIRKGMLLVGVGIAIGLILARVLAGALGTLLFGVSNSDPQTFAAVAVVHVAVALLACYLPARRAARVDPVVALRFE